MLKIRAKSLKTEAAAGLAAIALLGALPSAFGNYTESFESGTLNEWTAGTLNGSVGTGQPGPRLRRHV